MEEKKVFISYSQKDSLFAERLTNRLFEEGIEIWYDKIDINPGENWQERINDGINKASILLFIISNDSLKSTWTTYEARNFISKGKKIIPLLIGDVNTETIPHFLSKLQYIDFKGTFNTAFDKLIKALGKENVFKSNNKTNPVSKNKGYVFINYCKEDRDFLVGLKEFLKVNNYAYWEYTESKRDYHRYLFLDIEDAILNAVATLSVLSESWKQSKWALREYFFSEEIKKPIFLLKAKPTPPILVIAGLPFIDFTSNPTDGFLELKSELQRKNFN